MNDTIAHVLISREKLMEIDLEHYLLEYKKAVRKSKISKKLIERGLDTLKGMSRLEELGSFEEIMQSITLPTSISYSRALGFTGTPSKAHLELSKHGSKYNVGIQFFLNALFSRQNSFTWGYTTDEIGPGALASFLYPNVPPELDSRIRNLSMLLGENFFVGFNKQEIPMFLNGLRGGLEDFEGNRGVRFWDLREALEHLEKGLEAGFSDFLILFEDYYIAFGKNLKK